MARRNERQEFVIKPTVGMRDFLGMIIFIMLTCKIPIFGRIRQSEGGTSTPGGCLYIYITVSPKFVESKFLILWR